MLSQRLAILFLVFAALTYAQTAPSPDQPTESPHRHDPSGLESWTLNWPLPEEISSSRDSYPTTLVIARGGKVIRRIEGDTFVWKWIFLKNGRQVAYETGPLHWDLHCILQDVTTGKLISSYNCYRDIPKSAPQWVHALESAPSHP